MDDKRKEEEGVGIRNQEIKNRGKKKKKGKKKVLPDRESNPGLPRDRRRYLPLYYRGSEHL